MSDFRDNDYCEELALVGLSRGRIDELIDFSFPSAGHWVCDYEVDDRFVRRAGQGEWRHGGRRRGPASLRKVADTLYYAKKNKGLKLSGQDMSCLYRAAGAMEKGKPVNERALADLRAVATHCNKDELMEARQILATRKPIENLCN